MRIELKVTVEMTDQQVEEYAEEFGLKESNVAQDVRTNLALDLSDAAKSLFWTAKIS